jgi:TonB family protein
LTFCVVAIHALAAWHLASGSRSLILCLVRPMRFSRIVVAFFLAGPLAANSGFAAEAVAIPPELKKWVIHKVLPRYPVTARARGATGTGIFVTRVQIKTGLVKSVEVARTTGDSDLDAAAVTALRQWRFKPMVLPPIKRIVPHWKDPFGNEDSLVKTPVTFSR